MRVLSLAPGLDPARGGMASATTNMLLAGRRAGVGSVLAIPEHGRRDPASRALIDLLQRSGVVVYTLPVLPWPPRAAYRWGLSPAQVTWIGRHVAEFDLVHVHGVWGTGPLAGLVAGRMAGKPVVVTAHESLTAFNIDTSRSATRRCQKRLLRSLYLRYTTLFVFTSKLEAIASLPTSMRQRTVHYPVVDGEREVPELRPRGGERDLRVGFLGRIDPKKNLDLLIDSMAQLPGHVRLLVGGDGPDILVQDLRRRAAALGVSSRLEWLGFVEPGERKHFFEGLDLLVMPSAFESFGLSAAEAMLHGVPVLVSECSGIAEVIRRHGGGRIIQVGASAIAAAIGELDAERGVLPTMGCRGQAAVREELDYARIGRALRDAYAEAVG